MTQMQAPFLARRTWYIRRVSLDGPLKRRKPVKKSWLRFSMAAACALLAACAVITVNVYFPEKAAKEAYKSLDEMLLKGGADQKAPGAETPPGSEPAAPATEPKEPEAKPQSSLFDSMPRF